MASPARFLTAPASRPAVLTAGNPKALKYSRATKHRPRLYEKYRLEVVIDRNCGDQAFLDTHWDTSTRYFSGLVDVVLRIFQTVCARSTVLSVASPLSSQGQGGTSSAFTDSNAFWCLSRHI